MEDNKKGFISMDNKYKAFALSWLGFQYYIFNKEDGTKLYTFENTENFKFALQKLVQCKKEVISKINES